MVAQLTGSERRVGMIICSMIMVAGLLMAIVGQGDGMGFHGWIVLLFGALTFLALGNALDRPEPSEDRLAAL